MKFTPRFRKAAVVSAGVIILTVAGLSAVLNQKPVGCFSSYKMIPHDSGDVFRFTNGLVSHETCCGQMYLGGYGRSSNGTWIWHYNKTGKKKVFTNDYILHPGLFWLTCTDATAPTNTWRFPRRLFAPKEFD
jgi:hypothetical protein